MMKLSEGFYRGMGFTAAIFVSGDMAREHHAFWFAVMIGIAFYWIITELTQSKGQTR